MQVSALVTMYTHEEDIDSAIDVFTQAIQYYQSEQVRSMTWGSLCFSLMYIKTTFISSWRGTKVERAVVSE